MAKGSLIYRSYSRRRESSEVKNLNTRVREEYQRKGALQRLATLNVHWWLAATIVILIGSSLVTDAYAESIIKWVAIAALMATSMRFVLLIGELNFATAAFVGLGAYGAGTALTIFGLPFLLAVILGGVFAAAISVPFGFITLRTKGAYFLLIGFAFTEVVRILYTRSDFIGGNSGMIGIFPPLWLDPWMPVFVVGVAILFMFLLYVVEKSDYGKVLTAVRDNEDVVQTVGINVIAVKVACFTLASFAAGMAGVLHAFTYHVISPGDFGFLLSAFALAYVKIGGESTIVGPITGAILLVLLSTYAVGLGGGGHIFYGAAIVLAVLLMPDGIIGLTGKIVRLLKRARA